MNMYIHIYINMHIYIHTYIHIYISRYPTCGCVGRWSTHRTGTI